MATRYCIYYIGYPYVVIDFLGVCLLSLNLRRELRGTLDRFWFRGNVESMKTWLSYNWLKLTAILMALIAIAVAFFPIYSLPYVYYQMLNWVVLGAALVTASHAHEYNRTVMMWVFIILAVIFNPVAPFYLNALQWHMFDLVAIFLFFTSLILLKPKN